MLKVIVAVPLEIPAIAKEICPFEFVSPLLGATVATDSFVTPCSNHYLKDFLDH